MLSIDFDRLFNMILAVVGQGTGMACSDSSI